MRLEKEAIIYDSGVPVELLDNTGTVVGNTYALVGRASKQSMTEISYESHRKGVFAIEDSISNGTVVRNAVAGEDYIVLATMPEVAFGEKISDVCRMAVCNAKVTVETVQEEADEYGNITSTDVEFATDLPVYSEAGRQTVKQADIGVVEDNVYTLYMPHMDVSILAKVTLIGGGRSHNVKVIGIDNITFDGLSLVTVQTETR